MNRIKIYRQQANRSKQAQQSIKKTVIYLHGKTFMKTNIVLLANRTYSLFTDLFHDFPVIISVLENLLKLVIVQCH